MQKGRDGDGRGREVMEAMEAMVVTEVMEAMEVIQVMTQADDTV